MPTGLARQVEPDKGVSFDAVALGGGAAVLAGAVGLAGAWMARRSARPARRRPVPRPSRLGPQLAPLGPAATFGVHNALGPGPARATARSAMVAAALGTLAVAAAGTFAVSLDRLVGTPRLFGWDFDLVVGTGGEDSEEVEAAAGSLATDADVERVAVVEVAFATLGSENVEVLVLDQRKGSTIHPTLAEGRLPAGPGEITLGSTTMRRLGVGLGDRVDAAGVGGTEALTVVGQAVYPVLGDGGISNAGSMTAAAAAGLRLEESRGRLVLVDVAPGADAAAVVRRHTGLFAGTPVPPSEVTNLRQVGSAPWALAAFLALLALAAVGHALVLSVRAGRRSFAVLRALGFASRQVRAAVCWQASAIVAVGLVGVPLGVAAGRWTWTAVASRTGALADAVVPGGLLAALAAVALLAGNAVAAGPARAAARARPSEVLRAE